MITMFGEEEVILYILGAMGINLPMILKAC